MDPERQSPVDLSLNAGNQQSKGHSNQVNSLPEALQIRRPDDASLNEHDLVPAALRIRRPSPEQFVSHTPSVGPSLQAYRVPEGPAIAQDPGPAVPLKLPDTPPQPSTEPLPTPPSQPTVHEFAPVQAEKHGLPQFDDENQVEDAPPPYSPPLTQQPQELVEKPARIPSPKPSDGDTAVPYQQPEKISPIQNAQEYVASQLQNEEPATVESYYTPPVKAESQPPPAKSSEPLNTSQVSFPPPPTIQEPPQSAIQQYYPPPPPPPPQWRKPESSPTGGIHEYYAQSSSEKPPALPPRPPQRVSQTFDDDPSNPISYTRDPHKLIAYLVPFPKPTIKDFPSSKIPDRFLIYTPPPPPLSKPGEGEKESKVHKVQRKWEEEVRTAKQSTAKVTSWQGLKSKATLGINTAMSYTKSSSLEFLNRASSGSHSRPTSSHSTHSAISDNGAQQLPPEGDSTHKTVRLEELVLIYPPSLNASEEEVRAEFINTMMRSKSKAQREAIIATGLLPVSAAIDILATLIWPFGGLLEIDSVWAYSSIRGAKTARSVTKRLNSSTSAQITDKDTLHLAFHTSPRLELLRQYLANQCHVRNCAAFPSIGIPPTETEVLSAIGWAPSQSGGEVRNWEDEQWEMSEVKEDLKVVMKKAAREWDRWCREYARDPTKRPEWKQVKEWRKQKQGAQEAKEE